MSTLTGHRVVMSGGSNDADLQLALEITSLPKDARQKLLSEAGVTVEIDATQALAIKSELSIPWYRIRILRRLTIRVVYTQATIQTVTYSLLGGSNHGMYQWPLKRTRGPYLQRLLVD